MVDSNEETIIYDAYVVDENINPEDAFDFEGIFGAVAQQQAELLFQRYGAIIGIIDFLMGD